MSKNTVTLTERNKARLYEVAVALECDPDLLVNNFIMTMLESPLSIAQAMDFKDDEERNRVTTAATALDDGWECENVDSVK